jgi:hypothetical protein
MLSLRRAGTQGPAAIKSLVWGSETGLVKFGGREGARWALPEITLHETDERTKDPARGRADRKYKFRNVIFGLYPLATSRSVYLSTRVIP